MYEISKDKLRSVMPRFRKFLETDQAKDWVREREQKDAFFKKLFDPSEIDKIDEGDLRDLIRMLWAFTGWNNKDWLLEQVLTSGLPKIREAFRDLLYGTKPFATRFDKMREIRMMGAASISEILVHFDHTKYPIWNTRSKAGLITLGVDPHALRKSAQINGEQYEDFCTLAQTTLKEIGKDNPEITDLLDLDFLLFYVSTIYEEKPLPPEETFEHASTIDDIIQLGDGLGFEVEKEFYVTKGCKIDAIWRSRIANLGTIAYAFEVQKSGSRDSAILNLQRCKADPSIQKVIIVSSERELEKFKSEISSLSEDFRKSVGYFPINDLRKALVHQDSVREILKGIGLLGWTIG